MTARLTRRSLLASTAATLPLVGAPGALHAAPAPERAALAEALKRACRFMLDKASYRGGYVWQMLPDGSRRWGEMEALPTMVWVQAPSTPQCGHLFLDAFHATGDRFFHDAAVRAADALVAGQHPSGGWNYLIDFGPPEGTRRWYATVGANAWRLEEYQHFYGNATFDDAGSSDAMQLLLRLHAGGDRRYEGPLRKAIGWVLDAQYPVGGWPQRFPRMGSFSKQGFADYTGYITFNDDVASENMKFLVMARDVLGHDARIDDAIRRGMDCFVKAQQPQPQPAWGLQHTPDDLKPAAARTYEPRAFTTHTTAANIRNMMDFYELTGDPKFLARLPEALDWLDKVKLPAVLDPRGDHPTFLEPGTDRPLYVHRTGSNVVNGRYFVNDDPKRTIQHYSSFRRVDTAPMRARLAALKAAPPPPRTPAGRTGALPRFFTFKDLTLHDMLPGASVAPPPVDGAKLARVLADQGADGGWLTPLPYTSHPYAGPGPATPDGGDYATTHVGDRTDTSPFPDPAPVRGISTGVFLENAGLLVRTVAASRPA